MRKTQTEVLVIGGGATGTGILRDLAMRGFDAILVEKRDLTHGTTGRYHGLLHSGGRYAVKDPDAARECIEENRTLRRIMPHCIEDTGGFFVVTPWDDPDFVPRFLEGCRNAGIPVEEVPVATMLREEPRLNPNITHCFRVPDASADSFRAADATAESARAYGARVWTYHEVRELLREGDRVVGARCHDLIKDEEVLIYADMVVNAAGAWAGHIAATAGIEVHIVPGKGVMVAVSHRVVHTVVNRCRMPTNGDIIVPAHTVAIIGTTDVRVSDPEHFAVEPWEIELMLEEADKLVPGFKHMRILRAWAGVRPLYQETAAVDTRDITRKYTLLDHEVRDGVQGLLTITGGKWTTHRLMAEATVDKVCEKLGVERPCRTHEEPLPGAEHAGAHRLGVPLARVERQHAYRDLICECELATYDDVVRAIEQGGANTLDDVRRDTRLGMGPCQGGFCTYRASGILHSLRQPPVAQVNAALRDFLLERWKGLLPILWGQQLRQERLDALIYLSVLNTDHLPGPCRSHLAPVLYDLPTADTVPVEMTVHERAPAPEDTSSPPPGPEVDVLVIGAGLAGLTAAWRAQEAGHHVRVVTKGWGALYWHTGCVDVLGYVPNGQEAPVTDLRAALEDLVREHPNHPYAMVGLDTLAQALSALKGLCAEAGYPLQGSLERNWLLPSATGARRPTCLAPETMVAGDLTRDDPMLIVGFHGFHDFYPHLVAENLNAQGIPARAVLLELDALRGRQTLNGVLLARLLERPQVREELATALKPHLTGVTRVGFPAVLGLEHALSVVQDLAQRLEREVFEIPLLPPSVPGMRLHTILTRAIRRRGGEIYEGLEAIAAGVADGRVHTVWTAAAARRHPHRVARVVLATGGILGGGILTDPEGTVREPVMGLPVLAPSTREAWFYRDFLDPRGHPIYRAGIPTNTYLQPTNGEGDPILTNVSVVGEMCAGYDTIRERSFDGVALATGYAAGEGRYAD